MLKKHDTELEEDINSAESARGRMTDTLGSDNYPGLIRRGRGTGMPGRQMFGFLQPQTQGPILPSPSRSAGQTRHQAPSQDFSHYPCAIYDQVSLLIRVDQTRSRLTSQVLWFPRYCLDARPPLQYAYGEQWDMWRTFSDPLRQDPGILMQLAYLMDMLNWSTPQAPEYHRILSFVLIACQLQCYIISLSAVSHVFYCDFPGKLYCSVSSLSQIHRSDIQLDHFIENP